MRGHLRFRVGAAVLGQRAHTCWWWTRSSSTAIGRARTRSRIASWLSSGDTPPLTCRRAAAGRETASAAVCLHAIARLPRDQRWRNHGAFMAERPDQAIKAIASRTGRLTAGAPPNRLAIRSTTQRMPVAHASTSPKNEPLLLACLRVRDGVFQLPDVVPTNASLSSATARPPVMRIGSVRPSNTRTRSVGRATSPEEAGIRPYDASGGCARRRERPKRTLSTRSTDTCAASRAPNGYRFKGSHLIATNEQDLRSAPPKVDLVAREAVTLVKSPFLYWNARTLQLFCLETGSEPRTWQTNSNIRRTD
ncbi:hypothetical protein ACVMB1_000129 [Bradyrhizobium sp. USDA 4504]